MAQHSQSIGPDPLFQKLAAAVGATRKWAHTAELLVIDCWIALFYVVLYRFAIVLRTLAVLGLATVTLHFVGIPLRGLPGYGPVSLLGPPMALSHIALATWLVVRGFNEPEHTQRERPPAARKRSAR